MNRAPQFQLAAYRYLIAWMAVRADRVGSLDAGGAHARAIDPAPEQLTPELLATLWCAFDQETSRN
jgi:hypothetical protein